MADIADAEIQCMEANLRDIKREIAQHGGGLKCRWNTDERVYYFYDDTRYVGSERTCVRCLSFVRGYFACQKTEANELKSTIHLRMTERPCDLPNVPSE